jgi:hypothetical protein
MATTVRDQLDFGQHTVINENSFPQERSSQPGCFCALLEGGFGDWGVFGEFGVFVGDDQAGE